MSDDFNLNPSLSLYNSAQPSFAPYNSDAGFNLSGNFNQVTPFAGSFATPVIPTIDTNFSFNAPYISPTIATPYISASSFATPAINTSLSPSLSFGASSFSPTPLSNAAFGMDFMSPFQSAPGVGVPESREPTGRFTRAFENQILSEVAITPMEMLFAQPAAPADQFMLPAGVVQPSGQVGASLLGAQTAGAPATFTEGMSFQNAPFAQQPGPLAGTTMGQVGRDFLSEAGQLVFGRQEIIDPVTGEAVPLVTGAAPVPGAVGAFGRARRFYEGVQNVRTGLRLGAPVAAGVKTAADALFEQAAVSSGVREQKILDANASTLGWLSNAGVEVPVESWSLSPTDQITQEQANQNVDKVLEAVKAQPNVPVDARFRLSDAANDVKTATTETVRTAALTRFSSLVTTIPTGTSALTPTASKDYENFKNTGSVKIAENRTVSISSPEFATKTLGLSTNPDGLIGEAPEQVTRKVRAHVDENYKNLPWDTRNEMVKTISSFLTAPENSSYKPNEEAVAVNAAEINLGERALNRFKTQFEGLSEADKNRLGPQVTPLLDEYDGLLADLRENPEAAKAYTTRLTDIEGDLRDALSANLGQAFPGTKLTDQQLSSSRVTLDNYVNSVKDKPGFKYLEAKVSAIQASYDLEVARLKNLEGKVDQADLDLALSKLTLDINQAVQNLTATRIQTENGLWNNVYVDPNTGEFVRDWSADIRTWGAISGFVAPFLTIWLNREEREEQRSFERSMMYEKAGLEQRYWMERYRPAGGGGGGGGSRPQAPMSGRTDIPLVPISQ